MGILLTAGEEMFERCRHVDMFTVWSNFRKRMNDRRIVQSEARKRVDHVAEVCSLTWKKNAS